jgi:16S rRNA (guanine966-N2)-methyltransferase
MRIVSGENRGTRIRYPAAGLRPTRQIVKQAILNQLRPVIAGARVCDLFCGAGGLGLEAISSGAESVVFVEQDRRTVRFLRENTLPYRERTRIMVGDAIKCIARLAGSMFDVVLADPPYEQGLDQATLEAISAHDLLRLEGLVVLEHSRRDEPKAPSGLTLLKSRRFGDTVISVFRREE